MYPCTYKWLPQAAGSAMLDSQGFNRGFGDIGVEIEHHFGDDGSGVYIKETVIPAGRELHMHTHTFTHKSVLCKGVVRVTAGDVMRTVEAPAILTVEQGIPHKVESVTDAVWLCVHASTETDLERIDHAIVGG